MHDDHSTGDRTRRELCGVVGGTFDPIHRGHVEPVVDVCRDIAFDKVRYVPAATPPHRSSPAVAARHRLAMVKLAIAGHPKFIADDADLQRDGPSYMVDTLAQLHAAHPHETFALILGMDAFLTLPEWHRWRGILQSAHIVVMNRPGWTPPATLPSWWAASRITDWRVMQTSRAGCIVEHTVTPVDASSTAVRAAIAHGRVPTKWVDAKVATYILEHGLYGVGASQQIGEARQ